MSEEVRFFRRLSVYAFVVGAIYWFVSYEWIGTTLLVLFGVSAGVATLLLWSGAMTGRSRKDSSEVDAEPGVPDGPFGDESGRVPAASLSPFLVGLAVALAALGLVYGAWFILAALIPLAMGAGGWLSAARAELRGVEEDDAEELRS